MSLFNPLTWFRFAEGRGAVPAPTEPRPADLHAMVSATNRIGAGGATVGSVGHIAYSYQGNPGEVLNPYWPRGRRASAAYQVWWGQNLEFYDYLDEAVRIIPPLSSSIDTATATMISRDREWRVGWPGDTPPEDSAWRDEAEQTVLDFCTRALDPHVTAYLDTSFRNAVAHGMAFHEAIFALDPETGYEVPTKLIHRHPGLFDFNEMGTPFLYYPTTNNLGPEPLTFVKFPRFVIPDKYGNPWGRSIVAELGQEVVSYRDARQQLAYLLKFYGNPMVIGRVNAAAVENNAGGPNYNTIYRALKRFVENLGQSIGGVLPQNCEVEFKERGSLSGSSTPHIESIKLSERTIVSKILGSTLGVLEGEHQARAAATTHAEKQAERNKPLEALCVKSWNDWARSVQALNFDLSIYPTAVLDVDFDDKAALDAINKALDQLAKYDLPVSVDAIYEMLGLPKPSPDDETTIQKSPVPGPGAPPSAPSLRLGPGPAFAEGSSDVPAPKPTDVATLLDASADADVAREYVAIQQAATDALIQDDGGSAKILASEVKRLSAAAAASGGERVPTAKVDFPPEVRVALESAIMLGLLSNASLLDRTDAAKMSERKRRDVYTELHERVNMSPGEIRRFATGPGGDRAASRAVLGLIGKPFDQWSESDGADAARIVSYIDRLSSFRSGDSASKARRASLLKRFGSDPDRPRKTGDASIYAIQARTGRPNRVDFALSEEEVLELVPRNYRNATEWLLNRDVVSKTEVERMAADLAAIDSRLTAYQWEQLVRERYQALAYAVNEQVGKAVRERVAAAVETGTPWGEWVKTMDDLADGGGFSNAGDAYLQTVYRTEQGNAYAAGQEEMENLPGVAEFLWGWVLSNAGLELSRESHRAIDGIYVRRGSEAAEEMGGPPPWSYSCACVRSPILTIDPEADGLEETPNALELIRGLERFHESGRDCAHGVPAYFIESDGFGTAIEAVYTAANEGTGAVALAKELRLTEAEAAELLALVPRKDKGRALRKRVAALIYAGGGSPAK